MTRRLPRGRRLLLVVLLMIGVRGLSVFRAEDGTAQQQPQAQSGTAQEAATIKKPIGETDGEPLLLDDSEMNNLHVEGMADNSRCQVCHLNLAEQVFVKAEKHKPDAWLIAYEVKTCTECHGKHRIPSRKCKWK